MQTLRPYKKTTGIYSDYFMFYNNKSLWYKMWILLKLLNFKQNKKTNDRLWENTWDTRNAFVTECTKSYIFFKNMSRNRENSPNK